MVSSREKFGKQVIIAMAVAAACATLANGASANDRPMVGIEQEGEPTPIVTLYGIADVGIAHASHSLPVSNSFPSSMKPDTQPAVGTRSATGMINGGMQDSRWGIRVNLDIGEGRKAFTVLESGFNLPSGQLNDAGSTVISGSNNVNGNSSLNGQLFGRQAYVGVSDPENGSISFGRQYNFIYDVLTTYDPGMKSDLYSPLGLSGTIGGGGGVSEDSRLDNSIKYKNKFGDFNYGVIYKIGGINSATPTSGGALNVGYEKGPYGIQLTYDNFKDATKLDSATTVKLYNTTAWMLAAKYKVTDKATLKGGIQYNTLSSPSNLVSDGYFSNGLNYYGTKMTAADGIASGKPSTTTTITFFGGDYDLTEKTKIAVAQYLSQPQSNISDGGSQKSGTMSWTTLIADYRINKYLDVYAAAAFVSWSGDQFDSSTKLNSNSIFGTGLRLKF